MAHRGRRAEGFAVCGYGWVVRGNESQEAIYRVVAAVEAWCDKWS